MKLNLGSGKKRLKGFTNVDYQKYGDNTDIVYNLEKFPYPFKTNSIDAIYARCILEHLNSIMTLKILNEWWRICKPNALIYIEVPFEERWVDNLDHKKGFSYNCFFRMCRKGLWEGNYSFDLISIKNTSWGIGKVFPMRLREILSTYLKGLINNIQVELKVIKDGKNK